MNVAGAASRPIARFVSPIAAAALLLAAAAFTYRARRVPVAGAPKEAHLSSPGLVSVGGSIMGGSWSVKVPHLPEGMTEAQLTQQIAGLLIRLDADLSIYKPESAVSRFNRYRDADWFDVPPDLVEVVAEAQRISDVSGGAFDITVEPLVELWGFGPNPVLERGQIPSDAAIAAARSHVGCRRLEFRASPPAL